MKCWNCGSECNPQADYCLHCGADLHRRPQAPRKKSAPWWIIPVAVLGAFAAFILFAFIMAHRPADPRPAPTAAPTVALETTPAVAEPTQAPTRAATEPREQTSILNTSSMKFHLPDCSGAAKISDANRAEFTGSREDLISQGYSPCGICHP